MTVWYYVRVFTRQDGSERPVLGCGIWILAVGLFLLAGLLGIASDRHHIHVVLKALYTVAVVFTVPMLYHQSRYRRFLIVAAYFASLVLVMYAFVAWFWN